MPVSAYLHVESEFKMKLQFWSVGKDHEPYVRSGVEEFTRRIKHYYAAEWKILPVPKNAGMLSAADLKKKEGVMILEWLEDDDYLVVLDEPTKQVTREGQAVILVLVT